jgi:hypothetical protein
MDDTASTAKLFSNRRAPSRAAPPLPSHIQNMWEYTGTQEGTGAKWPTCIPVTDKAKRIGQSFS